MARSSLTFLAAFFLVMLPLVTILVFVATHADLESTNDSSLKSLLRRPRRTLPPNGPFAAARVRPLRRAWRRLNSNSHNRGHANYFRGNLVYVKIPKAASSTTAGIARRVAAKSDLGGARDDAWIASEPGVWANHRSARRPLHVCHRLDRVS